MCQCQSSWLIKYYVLGNGSAHNAHNTIIDQRSLYHVYVLYPIQCTQQSSGVTAVILHVLPLISNFVQAGQCIAMYSYLCQQTLPLIFKTSYSFQVIGDGALALLQAGHCVLQLRLELSLLHNRLLSKQY